MSAPILLASTSATRADMLRRAGIEFGIEAARIDEESIKAALSAEGARPRDVADALAEAKALKISARRPEALVIGSDQVLEHDGAILSKAGSIEAAREKLTRLRGSTHRLHSAAVVAREGRPIWRHVSAARMTMRNFSDAYRDDYLARCWDEIRHSVGCYLVEAEGVRLFSQIEGDHFTILGMPLVPLLDYLATRREIPG